MYFKIGDNIFFRKYDEYGLLVDNSLYGYRLLSDNTLPLEEKYVSPSASVILSMLSRKPKHIDDIIAKLMRIFVGVGYDELKKDVVEFYKELSDEGYIAYGDSPENCQTLFLLNKRDGAVHRKGKIAKEGDSKKYSLRSIHVEIVNVCNEKCVHCYIPHDYKTDVMSSEMFDSIIEQGRGMNIINITISGGEPLLHKDIIAFMHKCMKADLSVNLLTNLVCLTDELLKEMKKNPLLSVQTSLYSMNPSIHDSITKLQGSFYKTRDNILRLLSVGIPVQISCPVMQQNKSTFYSVVEWGKMHDIAVDTNYVIFGAYDVCNSNLVNRLSLDDIKDVFDKVNSSSDIRFLIEKAKHVCMYSKQEPVCSVCRYNICIAANGDVFPCVGWEKKVVGSLKKDTLKNIWYNADGIRKLRNITNARFHKCISCAHRGYCKICMMINFNENPDGNIFDVNEFYCKVAEIIHFKADEFIKQNGLEEK